MKFIPKKPIRLIIAIVLLASLLIFAFYFHTQEKRLFLKEIINSPVAVGAVAPSSQELSQAMVNATSISDDGYIVEIGAGTGSISKILLQKFPNKKVYIVEMSKNFVSYLKSKYASAQIIQGDAANLAEILPKEILGKVDCVVSGIPLTILTSQQVDNIITSAKKVLRPNGYIIQFTYRNYSPIANYKQHNLEARKICDITHNIPSASVWKYKSINPQKS